MTSVDHSGPVELRVLSALTSGAAAAWTVAQEVGEPESLVAPVLERAVDDLAVVKLDLAGSPVYSLTPKGLQALGLEPAAPEVAVESSTLDGAIDGAAPSPPVPAGVGAPAPPARPGEPVVVGSAPQEVVWRHVWYAAGYLLVGLFLLRYAPAVGLLAVLGGLVLGGYALRPRWRSGSREITTR